MPHGVGARHQALIMEKSITMGSNSILACQVKLCLTTFFRRLAVFGMALSAVQSVRNLLSRLPLSPSLVLRTVCQDVPGGEAGALNRVFRRWATKKAGGSTQNGRDSLPKYLGVKKFGGEKVIPGNIIVRQRGTRFHPGDFVGIGKDHTLFALSAGKVRFSKNKLTGRKWVHVDPVGEIPIHPAYLQSATAAPATV